MRVLVSGGGTAGHITPILATADALKSLDDELELLYVGQSGAMEHKIVGAAGIEFAAIKAGKFRRYAGRSWLDHILDLPSLWQNVRDSWRVLVGIGQSLGIIRRFRPDVIFIKGGYVGLPVGLAAAILRVPFVTHESDIVPGLTNRLLARWATQIAVGFPKDRYKQQLPLDRVVYTGNPVRSLVGDKHRLEGVLHFDLDPNLPVVLVMGGSQGAVRLNDCVLAALPQLIKNYQLIHLTGERDIERVKFAARELALSQAGRYVCHSFLGSELAYALAAADLVVSRAGANTIAEMALLKKPTILVPAAHLRDQPTNAQTLARAGAVRAIPEQRLSPHVLVAEIGRILESPEEQANLSRAISQFAVPDAAARLAAVIQETAR